ncbi:hypothetical protein GCM10010472_39170 [Pseudonocardia halophobica]|uniref:Uncharacterized protein n=1 Tax=Pseudonocardia halophobica TaxID=29401 RepID=A0A9W6L1R2_9PSEU|nr:hypothetical protein [Pseudonocardia halophobica]GLL11220.1 hypothetical protein GCM10017577_23610 [Pseudonocardia halophobica]
MTGALTRRTAGTLFRASLGRLRRRGSFGVRQLAVAAVLVLVGGALALCCCTDSPGRAEAGSAANAPAAVGLVAHRADPDQHDSGADTGDGRVLSATENPDAGTARLSASTAVHRATPGRAAERAGQGVRVAETCGAGATSDAAATAPPGRAMLTAPTATAVVSTAPLAPPAVIRAVDAQLLDHLVAQASPYRLCVMRT